MAKTIYQRKKVGAAIQVWGDGELDNYTRTEVQARIVELENLLALTDQVKDDMRNQMVLEFDTDGDRVDYFDDTVPAELVFLQDLNDYFDYDVADTTLTGYSRGNMTPDSVVDFPGEEVGHEVGLCIDGNPSTYWEYTAGNPPYSITFQLRDWPKRILGIRLRNTDLDLRASLQNIQCKVANKESLLDGANPRFVPPVSMVSGAGTGGWQEFLFENTAIEGRFLRLEGFTSEDANDQVRIREIQIIVGVR